MKAILAFCLATVPLAGCATILTPQRCEAVLSGAQTAQDIIAVLIARGVQPDIAAKVGNALALGQITLATACAAANPPVATVGQ
jgi:hypothetical protein